MRDWMATLWPASYMGAPFWIESDGAETGRRLSVSEFPEVDDPYIEDLGRKKRDIDIAGYFIGDVSDGQMTALETVCEGAGQPGTLVMPAQGPIQAYCDSIKRRRRRDKMGLFAFDAKFIRVGVASPLAPVEFLAQRVFDAVDGLAGAAPAFLNAAVSL